MIGLISKLNELNKFHLFYEESINEKLLIKENVMNNINYYEEIGYRLKECKNNCVRKYKMIDESELIHILNLSINKNELPGVNPSNLEDLITEVHKLSAKLHDESEIKYSCKDIKKYFQELIEMIKDINKTAKTDITFTQKNCLKISTNLLDHNLKQFVFEYSCLVQIQYMNKNNNLKKRIFTCGERNNGFLQLYNLKNEIKDFFMKELSIDINENNLKGKYDLILSPEVASLFMHEAIGHLLEADNFEQNEYGLDIGKVVGPVFLNVIDDPTLEHMSGSFVFDDEGTEAAKKYLIKDGIIANKLGNIEFSIKEGRLLAGNARALDINYEPIIRMSNTYIKPGSDDIVSKIDNRERVIYLDEILGGNTNQNIFFMSVGKVYLFENGRKAECLNGMTISLDIIDSIRKISLVGNDLKWIHGGMCGKKSQNPLPVSMGSPHIMIKDILI